MRRFAGLRIFAIGEITLGPFVGRVTDRTGRKRVAVASGFPVALFGIALVLGFPRLLLYAALGYIGTVAGALGAAAIWQAADLGIALVLASFAALAANLVLVLLPADRRPAMAAPATLAAAGG